MTPSAQVRRLFSAIVPGAVSLAFLLAVPVGAFADATFTLVNLDPPDVGYNDPTPVSPVAGNPGTTLGEQRLNAVRYAAEIWGGLLDSNVDIRIAISTIGGCVFGGYTSVASVVRDFAGAPFPNTWYPIALANKLAGVDLCPEGGSCTSSEDINILLARDCGWYLGLHSVPPGTRDWVSLMLHETAHGLGFTTPMNIFTGEKLMGLDDIYMRKLEDHETGKLYPNMTDGERLAGNMNPPNLHWIGPSVVAASGILSSGAHPSGHVEMLAYSGGVIFGTSVYHFGASSPPQLMGPAVPPTQDVGLALEVMRDLGWFAESPPAWQCYPARDLKDPQFAPVSVLQSDAIGSRTATLRKPVMLCNSANVGTGQPPTPARHLVCYQVKDVGETSPSTVSIEDQFGTLSLTVKKPKVLCVPAVVSPLP